MTDLATVAACEERLVNVWPSPTTQIMGDWVMRYAHGYSGRANSASAIRAGADLSSADIEHIVRFFRQFGLTPAIRVSPLARSDLGARLMAGGWTPVVTSIGMVATATARTPQADVTIAPAATPAWVDGVSGWQEGRKRNPDHLMAIVGAIRLPAAFATVAADGHAGGYAMAVLDRGMAEIGSVLIDPASRGRGLGRRIVAGLMGWAHAAGAERIFLQVEHSNAVAIALYRSLGFAEAYRYTEYRLP